MAGDDLEEVLALERRCQLQPWSAELFRAELANPFSRIDLLRSGGRLAGYICIWVVGDELQIHNVVTDPEFRRRGVARALVENALFRGRHEGAGRALLEVRITNEAAIALYRSFGFVRSGVRRRYYADGEDAVLMELVLGPVAAAPLQPDHR